MNFEKLQEVNQQIKTMNIKGKEYATVNERILAFRKLYPEGFITTELLSDENGKAVVKASVGTYDLASEVTYLLATGTAYETEGSSYINKTSYIENCETSAVGRALAMLGIGIDTSIASASEVSNAIDQQEEYKEAYKKLLQLLADKGITRKEFEEDTGRKIADMSTAQLKQAFELYE